MPTKHRGISTYDEVVLTMVELPKDIAMEIIIMGSWSTWMVRNDKISRHAPPHVNSWKYYLKEGLGATELRAKHNKAEKIRTWVTQYM